MFICEIEYSSTVKKRTWTLFCFSVRGLRSLTGQKVLSVEEYILLSVNLPRLLLQMQEPLGGFSVELLA